MVVDTGGNSEFLAAAQASALGLIQQMSLEQRKRSEEEVQAYKRVSEDLLDSDLSNNHLDLDLTQEEQFLVQYMSLLDWYYVWYIYPNAVFIYFGGILFINLSITSVILFLSLLFFINYSNKGWW